MTAIMRHQRDFFLTDDELKLRPMILEGYRSRHRL